MRHFATESGKSKGQFYTPAEVSRVMAKILGDRPIHRQDQTVYDPTCGSGSLLLKVADEAPRGSPSTGKKKTTPLGHWRMNMILHGNETAEIWKGNTITSPQLTQDGSLKTFDFAVANPPFSIKSGATGSTPRRRFGRFAFGRAAGEERRLRLPAAHRQITQEHGQGRGHPAPRRAVPRQRRGGSVRLSSAADQGHHWPAGEPLLRHRHPGLHRRARQGERPRSARASS